MGMIFVIQDALSLGIAAAGKSDYMYNSNFTQEIKSFWAHQFEKMKSEIKTWNSNTSQIIISMYTPSLVKIHYLLKLSSKTKIWICIGQITVSKIEEICPLAIPNLTSVISMHTSS